MSPSILEVFASATKLALLLVNDAIVRETFLMIFCGESILLVVWVAVGLARLRAGLGVVWVTTIVEVGVPGTKAEGADWLVSIVVEPSAGGSMGIKVGRPFRPETDISDTVKQEETTWLDCVVKYL